jgi:hypothetical protein
VSDDGFYSFSGFKFLNVSAPERKKAVGDQRLSAIRQTEIPFQPAAI